MKGISVINKFITIVSVICVWIFLSEIKAQNITDITIVVTFNSEPSDLSAKIAPLKYNKKFALSMQIDDGGDAIINEGFPVFEGGTVNGTNYSGYTYTDGCGNHSSFKMSSAMYPFSSYDGRDVHNDPESDVVTWDEMNTLYEAGWGIENHGESDHEETTPSYIDYSIKRNISYTRRKMYNTTPGGVMTNVFVNPNGSTPWTQPAINLGEIGALNQDNEGPLGDNGGNVNANDLNWYNSRYNLYRRHADGVDVKEHIDKLSDSSVNGANYWAPIFSHNLSTEYPFNTFVSDFEYIYNTYGAGGTDEILMTTDEEIIDYLIVRDGTTFNQSLNGNTLTLTFSGTYPTNLLFYDLSLVINSDVAISDIAIEGTEDFVSGNLGDTTILINFGWDDFIVPDPEELASSFVDIAVSSQTEYDALIAMDYVIVLDYGDFKAGLVDQLCQISGVDYDEGFCNSGYPDFVEITGDSIITSGETALLTATHGLNYYLWSTEETTRTISVNPVIDSEYWVKAVTMYGDTVRDNFNVTVRESYIVDHSPLVINHIVGTIDSLWVELKDDASPLWDDASTNNYLLVDPSVTKTYHLDVYYNGDIVNELNFLVEVGNLLEFTYDSVCFGDTTSFKNISSVNDTIVSILWDLDGDTQFDDAEGDTVSWEYDASGIYLVGMRIYFKNDPMDVVYNPVPVGDIPVADFEVSNTCFGNTTEFEDMSTVEVGSVSKWFWDFGNGVTDEYPSTTTVYDQDGQYEVLHKAWSDIGCVDSIIKQIDILEIEEIKLILESGTAVNEDDTVFFSEGKTVTIFLENFNSYDSVIWYNNERASSITISEEGSFSVVGYKQECNDNRQFNTSWGSSPQPSGSNIMNLITPNGDGYNDFWLVNDSTIVAPFKVSIFGRNGKLVYSNDNYQNDWSGTYNGNVLPQGAYYYVIEDNDGATFKGSITIIR